MKRIMARWLYMPQNLDDIIAISSLSLPERVVLAQELWDSIHADACAAPFTPEQLAEIDRRISALDAGEMKCESWESVRDRVRSEL